MKQVIAQAIVAVLLVLVVGFFVWMFRARRAARASGATALAALARDLGATDEPRAGTGLHGTFGGRRCTIAEKRRPGSDDTQPYVHLQIACDARATFQVHRSESGLASIAPPDLVKTEDQEFDVQLIVRSTDADRAKRLLSPDLRRRLLDWFRRGALDGIWWKDGQLLIDGGYGFQEGWQIEQARLLLEVGVQLADGLERA